MKERLLRLKDIALISVLIETVKQWQEDKVGRVAGALAFFSILSLAPQIGGVVIMHNQLLNIIRLDYRIGFIPMNEPTGGY